MSRAEKGRGNDKGHDSHRHVVQDYRVWEATGQQVEYGKGGTLWDERWSPEGGDEVQVEGRSVFGRVVREKLGTTEINGAASNDDRWGGGRW